MDAKELLDFGFRESHRLLKHYASLLNVHDGGKRDIPESADEWLARLIGGPTTRNIRPDDDDFTRRAWLVRVIDGDTVELAIDVGFTTTIREKCRLFGINAPEVRGVDDKQPGRDATQHISELLAAYGPTLLVRTYKNRRGKFGRYLVEIWGIGDCAYPQSINARMIADGFAVPYMEKR